MFKIMNEFKKVMLISPDTIKSYGDLNYNVDDEVIGASIRTVQNVCLKDVLSTNLVEKLQYLVYNDIKGLEDSIESAENAVYKTLLEDYVKEAMGYRVVSEICLRISLKISERIAGRTTQTSRSPTQKSTLLLSVADIIPSGPTSPHVPMPADTPLHSSPKTIVDIGPVTAEASVGGSHIIGFFTMLPI